LHKYTIKKTIPAIKSKRTKKTVRKQISLAQIKIVVSDCE